MRRLSDTLKLDDEDSPAKTPGKQRLKIKNQVIAKEELMGAMETIESIE